MSPCGNCGEEIFWDQSRQQWFHYGSLAGLCWWGTDKLNYGLQAGPELTQQRII